MIDLLWHLLALYVAVAAGFVGFGMMFAGSSGAKRVARFFFLQPLQYLWGATRERLRQLLAYIWHVLIEFMLAPIGRTIARGFWWVVTRERGWLGRRQS